MQEIIGLFFISLLVILIVISIVVPKIGRSKLLKLIENEALSGNKNAIMILRNRTLIDLERKNILLEAIRGNENAIKILNIHVKPWD